MPNHDPIFERGGAPPEDGRSDRPAMPRKGDSRPRLLLVDDEPLVGRMLSHAANECGFRAAVAVNGTAFRREYEAETPEVILLDLSLKSGDGIELMRFLAEKDSRALVLIVSGFDQRVVEAAERLGKALGLRMGGCLTKPIFVKELADAIERGRRSSALERETNHGDLCLGS